MMQEKATAVSVTRSESPMISMRSASPDRIRLTDSPSVPQKLSILYVSSLS